MVIKRLEPKTYKMAIKTAELFYRHKLPEEYIKKFLADNRNYLLVALEGESILGFILGYQLNIWHKVSRELLLYDIEVLQAQRRHGIGRNLFNELKKLAIESQYSEIWIPTSRLNSVAIEFYKSLGATPKNDDIQFVIKLN